MARTDADTVKAILLDNYGKLRDGTLPDLTPFIAKANLLVNRVATCATNKGIALTTDELTTIETWMAAHFYTKADPLYTSRTTADASASFVVDPKVPEAYKAGALDSDPSGCLSAILNRQRAGVSWLGKVPSEEIPIYQRD